MCDLRNDTFYCVYSPGTASPKQYVSPPQHKIEESLRGVVPYHVYMADHSERRECEMGLLNATAVEDSNDRGRDTRSGVTSVVQLLFEQQTGTDVQDRTE